MKLSSWTKTEDETRHTIAAAFVNARLNGGCVLEYPANMPSDLDEAYAIQDDAIKLWPQEIVGWKVGGLSEIYAAQYGTDRLTGPVFKHMFKDISGQSDAPSVEMKVLSEGFAAVEAEIVIIVAQDAPADKQDWSREDAQSMVGSFHAGIEIASSPFAGINEFGPLVTISDFGNNYGLILGPEIDATASDFGEMGLTTYVDDEKVGTGSPANLSGGPLESFRKLLEISSKRGLPLKKGMAVTTGALTGIHPVKAGQSSRIEFGEGIILQCHFVKA